MQSNIHPTYYPEAKIVCASCNSSMVTGSTQPEMRVEVCSNCHPFYTGKQNLIDTAGRVDRFKRMVSRRESIRATRSSLKSKKKAEA
ncbi:MAG: 50S ribosomal protein L31 [Candidatus Kerfeldbacteria bacterium]|nr:50S ribosomal protein L31 [Candidatus Kerfeldbacteria bacterium]